MSASTLAGRWPVRIAASAGLAALVAVPLAFAQPAPGAAPQQPRQERQARPAKPPAQPSAVNGVQRADAQLAYARSLLKITPEQETRWTALAEVIRRHAAARDTAMAQHRATPRPDRSRLPEQTIIQKLERQQQMGVEGAKRMEARAKAMGEVIAAARPLYESLDPEQRKVADSLMQRHAMAGKGGQHGRGPQGGPPQHRQPGPPTQGAPR